MLKVLVEGGRLDKAALIAGFMDNRPIRSLRLALERHGPDTIAWMRELNADSDYTREKIRDIDVFSELAKDDPHIEVRNQRVATRSKITDKIL